MPKGKLDTPAALNLAGLTVSYLAIPFAVGATSTLNVWLTVGLAIPLIWLSLSDLADQEIPDLATLAVAEVGFFAWGEETEVTANALAAGVLVAVLCLASELACQKAGRDVLGLGDVKLIGTGVLVVGASSAWIMIVLASAGGILAALLARRRHNTGIPFGPFLAYAIFITFLMFGART